MTTITHIAKSYAKINLGLRVLKKLDSGYHEIETGFVFINWYDRLELTQNPETLFRCSNKELPTGDSNLVMKALKIMREESGLRLNYRIHLSKQVPLGSGLGGGSSNAALLLRMINHIEKFDLTDQDLARLGARIGADVPLFIYGKTAIGSGSGSELTFMDVQPDAWIVTVYPGFESSTAAAYALCEPYDDGELRVQDVLNDTDMDEWESFLVNDLEPPVIYENPLVGNLKDQLYDMGAVYASMSGSGSSVYGLFSQEIPAVDAYEYLLQEGHLVNLTNPLFVPDHSIYVKS